MSYWKRLSMELVAITDVIGNPTFFITLTQNDAWYEITSIQKKGLYKKYAKRHRSNSADRKRFSKQSFTGDDDGRLSFNRRSYNLDDNINLRKKKSDKNSDSNSSNEDEMYYQSDFNYKDPLYGKHFEISIYIACIS